MLLSTIGFVLSMWEGQKMSRKASEIIETSMEIQPKPKKTNGFQRERSKQAQKQTESVQTSVKKYYCGIVGGEPPPDAIFFDGFCTLSVYVLTCFELSL